MHITTLTADRLEEAADVLSDAFADYPVMRYVIGPAGSYSTRLRRLVTYFTLARFLNGDIVLGAVAEGTLAAIANITPPGPRQGSTELAAHREALWRILGQAARDRYEGLGRVWQTFAIELPHYHLNMIGVRGSFKGRGAARLLVDALHERSARDPGSCGVSLTTEDAANVPLYEHLGYRVVGWARVTDTLQTWGFFRPDDAAADA